MHLISGFIKNPEGSFVTNLILAFQFLSISKPKYPANSKALKLTKTHLTKTHLTKVTFHTIDCTVFDFWRWPFYSMLLLVSLEEWYPSSILFCLVISQYFHIPYLLVISATRYIQALLGSIRLYKKISKLYCLAGISKADRLS